MSRFFEYLRRLWLRVFGGRSSESRTRQKAPIQSQDYKRSLAPEDLALAEQLEQESFPEQDPRVHLPPYQRRQRELDDAERGQVVLVNQSTKPGYYNYKGRRYMVLGSGTLVRVGKPTNGRVRKLERKRAARLRKRASAGAA